MDPSGHKAKSLACIYYDSGHDLKKQAKNSPYYRNENVKFFAVHTNAAFKKAWGKINSKIVALYMYIHTGFENGYGKIFMRRQTIDLKKSLVKRNFTKKPQLKFIKILGCKAAKGGNKSVAKNIHDLAPKASIYASYESVSFYKVKNTYYARYSKAYLKKHPYVLNSDPTEHRIY